MYFIFTVKFTCVISTSLQFEGVVDFKNKVRLQSSLACSSSTEQFGPNVQTVAAFQESVASTGTLHGHYAKAKVVHSIGGLSSVTFPVSLLISPGPSHVGRQLNN
jgi:hypothetical protein